MGQSGGSWGRAVKVAMCSDAFEGDALFEWAHSGVQTIKEIPPVDMGVNASALLYRIL